MDLYAPFQDDADAIHGCSGSLHVLPASNVEPFGSTSIDGLLMPYFEYHSTGFGGYGAYLRDRECGRKAGET